MSSAIRGCGTCRTRNRDLVGVRRQNPGSEPKSPWVLQRLDIRQLRASPLSWYVYFWGCLHCAGRIQFSLRYIVRLLTFGQCCSHKAARHSP